MARAAFAVECRGSARLAPQEEDDDARDESIDRGELLALTAEIVSAHVGNNAIAGADVGALIQSVFDTLGGLAADEPATPPS